MSNPTLFISSCIKVRGRSGSFLNPWHPSTTRVFRF
uniref:Uncharacterized protein n=1 Tax=Triticum urartu TaxID=4572 RepID=A0A8R7QP15_TRIUA